MTKYTAVQVLLILALIAAICISITGCDNSPSSGDCEVSVERFGSGSVIIKVKLKGENETKQERSGFPRATAQKALQAEEPAPEVRGDSVAAP